MDWTAMKMAGITRLLVLFSFLFAVSLAGAEIFFPRPFPVFSTPDAFTKVQYVLPPGYYKVKKSDILKFSTVPPMAYYARFAELESGHFASPALCINESGKTVFVKDSRDWRIWCVGILISALAVFSVIFVKEKIKGRIPPDSPLESAGFVFIALSVRWILLLYEIAFWGNALPGAADEPGYFQAVSDIMNGKFSGPWHFTVGLGIIYLPFIRICNAVDYYDIAIPFCHFNAIVVAPAAIAVTFFVLKKFHINRYCAFAAVLLWALYPFFVYHKELWNIFHFEAFTAIPTSWESVLNWWKYYAVCINTGFNGMSDMPGLLMVMCTVLMAGKLKSNAKNTFFIGMAYGFCCLIRINYILFAPLAAFVWLHRYQKTDIKTLLCTFAAAAGGFFSIFGWQLLINFYQFGNIFTFGYSLHYLNFPPDKRPDAGFTLSTLLELKNIHLLIGANKLLMTAGIAGLLCIRDRVCRISLTLFAVPLILFFFGYSHTYCDARRFILAAFPVFLAAYCTAWGDVFLHWKKDLRKNLRLWIILFLTVLFWPVPDEICAICLFLLLLRSIWDLHQELFRDILKKDDSVNEKELHDAMH